MFQETMAAITAARHMPTVGPDALNARATTNTPSTATTTDRSKDMAALRRTRGYVPRTQEEIDAVWADARQVAREEQHALRRRWLGLPPTIICERCDRSFGTDEWRHFRHKPLCWWKNRRKATA